MNNPLFRRSAESIILYIVEPRIGNVFIDYNSLAKPPIIKFQPANNPRVRTVGEGYGRGLVTCRLVYW